MTAMNEIPEENKIYIERHQEFAISIARKFHRARPNLPIELEDYIGAALLGLCEAARRFDKSQGQHFRSFSYLRIRGALYELLCRSGGVSRRYFSELVSARNDEVERSLASRERLPFAFTNDLSELATLSVIMEELGLKLRRSSDSKEILLSYANEWDPESQAEGSNLRNYLYEKLRELPAKQREVIERRYFEHQTYEEISAALNGISRSWLSRVHNAGLRKIKDQITTDSRECDERVAQYAA